MSEVFIKRKIRAAQRMFWPSPDHLYLLGFDIVHGCQLRCIGCPNSTLKPQIKHISLEDFRLCLGNVDAKHIDIFRPFNFGEPLLHPDVPGILRIVKEQPWRLDQVQIHTNAQHHDFPMLRDIFKTGILTKFSVSCDGDGTAAEYERLRPPARWDKLIEFLRRAKELRDQYAPLLPLTTTTACDDADGRRRWNDLLKKLGWIPEFRDWIILPESAQNPSERKAHLYNHVCRFLRGDILYLIVDYDGSVVPCCAHPRAFVLGDLKHQKLSDILRSTERKKKILQLRFSRNKMPVCGQCEV